MSKKVLALFDVDGTLTKPRGQISPQMLAALAQLRKRVPIAIVGGSDLKKQEEQIGPDVLKLFDYVFSENGLDAFQDGERLGEESLKSYLGEEKVKEFVKYTLRLIADQDIPVMRGTFIEFRKGMFNVSPIGRNCSQEEREAFEQYDKEHNIRENMVKQLREHFSGFGLQFSIGGQISFDVFPEGWNKTYCLRYLQDFDEIHFFGDKTMPGGNDYEIFMHERTIGHTVTSPDDTIKLLQELFSAN
ncbi:Phosphomannomutase [Balamuthia mandrillaris]